MIENITRSILGHIECSYVEYNKKWFLVSTVNLTLRRIENVMAEWRDDWWEPPYPMETMVWGCDENKQKTGRPIHCHGCKTERTAKKKHEILCRKIEKSGDNALNHREMQTKKESVDNPTGLMKTLNRKRIVR